MGNNSREKLIKEYEMLLNKLEEYIIEDQIKIVPDDRKSKELANLYIDSLKDYIREEDNSAEETINIYFKMITNIRAIDVDDHINKEKNNIKEMIKKKIVEMDGRINDYIDCKEYYINKLNTTNCSYGKKTEIEEGIEDLTNKELDILKKFSTSITYEINSKMTKTTEKVNVPMIIKEVGLCTLTILGTFMLQKVQEKAEDYLVDKGTKILRNIFKIPSSTPKNNKNINCINKDNSKSLERNNI